MLRREIIRVENMRGINITVDVSEIDEILVRELPGFTTETRTEIIMKDGTKHYTKTKEFKVETILTPSRRIKESILF